MSTSELFTEVLSLPVRDRAALVRKLLSSLESKVFSPEVEKAWKDEALDRCRAFDAGELTEHDVDDVLRNARAKFK